MGALARAEDDKPQVIVSRDPSTGEVLGEVPVLDAEQIRAAVARARVAQADWAQLSVRERCERVRPFRDEVLARAEEVAALITRESGKTLQESLVWEVTTFLDLATYFCKRAPKILAPESISLHLLKNRGSYLHYAPRGVVGIISPWNLPFTIPGLELVMALLAGNGVVLKPSEVTPLTALKIKELYDAAGLPPDLFQVVTGRGPAGVALLDAGIDYCAFTGSTATGRKVGAACGERLIPCALELGGKAAAIVCADADVARTARGLVWGAFSNQGQACVSIERVYAHQAIHDELVEAVIAETKRVRQGDPGSTAVDTGSMTWERQVELVEERIRAAVEAGARVRTGGARSGVGLQFQPTVLTDCRQDMEVMRREVFGPVLPIMKVRDEEEALALANDSSLGLAGYIYTDDTQKGRRLAERLEVGSALVNDAQITFGAPETPWGGVKQSGLGHTHGELGLKALCQVRHVNYDRLRFRRELWWYPYSEKRYRQGLKMLKWLFRG